MSSLERQYQNEIDDLQREHKEFKERVYNALCYETQLELRAFKLRAELAAEITAETLRDI